MEQTSHLRAAATDAAEPESTPRAESEAAAAAAQPTSAGEAALREELAKWRERVPKLAAALRNRAEEAESLRQEIERLRKGGGARDESPAAGIRARDDLIDELQKKLADLAERHKVAQGELHAQQLTIDELKTDAEAWKGKWQSVTRSLDEQAEAVSSQDQRTRALEDENAGLRKRLAEQVSAQEAQQRVLDQAVEERDSLRGRNEQLFETTEIANRQIGSLTDSLTELRGNLQQLREQQAALATERDRAATEAGELRERVSELEGLVGEHDAALQQARTEAETARRETESAREEAESARQQADAREARIEAAEAAVQAADQAAVALAEELHLTAVAAASGASSVATAEQRLAEFAREREAADAARRAAEDGLAEAESAAEARLAEAQSAAEQRLAEQQAALDAERAEVQRLTEVVEHAQQTTGERETERRDLSDRLQSLENRNRHLEEQLGERSTLVVTLEQDQAEAERSRQALQEERDALEESLMRAERNAKENADYVAQLDAKLDRQKELMDSLEEELAEAKDEAAQAQRALKERPPHSGSDRSGEAAGQVDALRDQVRKLEALVRERTETLNRLQWQVEVAGEPAAEADGDADPAESNAKLLLVLNQQLADERSRNAELRERVRQLECTTSTAPSRDGDDLTRIHGVGHKLAEQLNELGIYRYQQIAELDAQELDDEAHALHAHRARIARDRWIEQAVKLISH
jgi:predicted flap endonuclease-1-like 5' DNA nuclease